MGALKGEPHARELASFSETDSAVLSRHPMPLPCGPVRATNRISSGSSGIDRCWSVWASTRDSRAHPLHRPTTRARAARASWTRCVRSRLSTYSALTPCLSIPRKPTAETNDKCVFVFWLQIVIGTPGKLKNWMSSKPLTLDPKHIKVLVFDEADQMFDSEGFLMDSTRMVKKITEVSKQCQILLFSATFSDTVRAFAVKHVRRANQVRVHQFE
jgi:hypothetical protein